MDEQLRGSTEVRWVVRTNSLQRWNYSAWLRHRTPQPKKALKDVYVSCADAETDTERTGYN